MQRSKFLVNKENTLPSTPGKNKVSPKKPALRVPLGGKDKNSLITAIKPIHRLKKLRSSPLKKKLAVHRDEDVSSVTENGDLEVETKALPQPELPYIPLNYTPFTQEDLANLAQSPTKSMFKELKEEDEETFSDSELPLDFQSDEEMEEQVPHFMKSTFNSQLKHKQDNLHEGLTLLELQKLIDDE